MKEDGIIIIAVAIIGFCLVIKKVVVRVSSLSTTKDEMLSEQIFNLNLGLNIGLIVGVAILCFVLYKKFKKT